MSPLRGFEPQAVSPNKVIPAGWRVSCAPLSACLYSRPEERCGEDYPRWTVWNDNFWSTFMRIQTSDLPILLSDTPPADILQNRAPNTKEAVPTTIRLQTLDLKTSQSALPAGQKKKFGVDIREDSNLSLVNIAKKCSYSWVERQISKRT